jgi:N-ethylmaleimide reductase
MAELTGTPIEHMSGDAVVHHFRRLYVGTLILNFGLNANMVPARSPKEPVI